MSKVTVHLTDLGLSFTTNVQDWSLPGDTVRAASPMLDLGLPTMLAIILASPVQDVWANRRKIGRVLRSYLTREIQTLTIEDAVEQDAPVIPEAFLAYLQRSRGHDGTTPPPVV